MMNNYGGKLCSECFSYISGFIFHQTKGHPHSYRLHFLAKWMVLEYFLTQFVSAWHFYFLKNYGLVIVEIACLGVGILV